MSRLAPPALIVLCALVGCGGGGGDSSSSTDSSTPTSTTATQVPTVNLVKAGATKTKINGDWLVAGDGAIWLTDDTKIHRLNAKTGQPDGEVPVPGGPCLGGAYGFGALFAETCYNDEGLVRVDPSSLKVTDQISLPTPDLYNQEGSIAAGEGAVWLIIDGQGCEACVLAGFDPDTLRMTHEIELDPGAASVAVGNGLLWVSDSKANRVLRVDPRTDEVLGSTDVGGLPQYLTVDENGAWVLNQLEGTVMQLDPGTGEVVKTIDADVAGAGGSITVGEGSVWVRGTLKLLTQIDSATGEVVARYGPDEGSGDALVDDGVLWVSAFDAETVFRIPLADLR